MAELQAGLRTVVDRSKQHSTDNDSARASSDRNHRLKLALRAFASRHEIQGNESYE